MSRESNPRKMTRRNFAKASAAATAFGVLASRGAAAETNSDTITIGLIGCGGRGTGAAFNNLQGNEHVKIIALADVFEDKLNSTRERLERDPREDIKTKVAIDDDHCFVGLDAYEKLLATDVDMIIHATPPYARPMHIEAAVNAGKHLFTEKPVAVDAPGIRQFMAAAKKAEEKGLSFVTGTQRRHQKSYLETMKKIQDGAIGEVLAGRAYWCGTLPFAHERKEQWSDLEYRLRNWYNYIWTCGDNVVEQHIHNLDVLNWAMQAHPVQVFASGGRTWKPKLEKYGNIWDHFSCDFEYPGERHVISMSRHWKPDSAKGVFEHVTGTKGMSNCRDMGKDDQDPYVQEHINLLASIRNEGPYLNEGVRTAESTFTAILGRDAAYSGKDLKWDEHLQSNHRWLPPEDLSFEDEYPVGDIPVPGEVGLA